jgi:hypothetical protein
VRRVTLQRILLAGAVLALVASLGLYWAWVDGRLIRWAENWLVRQYLKEVEPNLPFKIRSVDVEAPWEDFKKGRIRRFSIVLEREPVRVLLEGPLDIRPQETKDGIHYAVFFDSPKTQLQWRWKGEWKNSPSFALVFWVQSNRGFTRIAEMGAKLSADQLELLPFHTVLEKLQIRTEWDETSGAILRTSIQAPSVRFQESDSKMGDLKGFSAEAELPLQFFPFSLGQEALLRAEAQNLEALLDPYYVDVPLKAAKLHARLALQKTQPIGVQVSIGETRTGRFGLSLRPEYVDPNSFQLKQVGVDLKLERLPIPPWVKIAQSFPELSSVIDVEVTQGLLDVEAKGIVPFDSQGLPMPILSAKKMLSPWLERFTGSLRIRNLSALWKRLSLAIRGIELEVPFDLKQGAPEANLKVDRIAFRRWEGGLPRTPFSLTRNRDAAREVFRLEMEDGLSLENRQGLSPEISSFLAKFRPGEEDLFEVRTGLRIEKTPVEPWFKALCVPLDPVPPAEVAVELHRIIIYPDAIEPRGAIRVNAFQGELEVTDMGAYEWTSSVPEIDFSARFEGFLLEKLGPWLGFGKMEGTLQGYANSVTLVGPVPTNYDFRIELKPTKGDRVVFSPQAMKNFVEMVAGSETLRQVPWPGNWLYFGWPREIIGGYDVKYAGLTAFASNGSILVETLDPPGSKEHYILKSSSAILDKDTFSVKLASRSYPAVLDAEGIRAWMGNVIAVVENLAKERQAGQEPKAEVPCLPKEFDVIH